MNVLIACEFSGIVRDAFTKRGHNAISCDLLPSEKEGRHYQGDVRDIIDQDWDLMIAFPPCTYLCTMGIWWNSKRPERWELTYNALKFIEFLWNAKIHKIAIENPIGYLNNHFMKPSQIIHPWMFGDEANKPTCLWLKNLPLLTATKIVEKGEFYTKANGKRISKWLHTTSGTKKEKHFRIANRTFQGIADAMAEQWE